MVNNAKTRAPARTPRPSAQLSFGALRASRMESWVIFSRLSGVHDTILWSNSWVTACSTSS